MKTEKPLHSEEVHKNSIKSNKKMVFTLMLINFTEVLGFAIMMPVLPFLATDLGLDPLKIGLISSLFSFCQFFASPITGKLSDQYGRKPLLIFSQISTFIGFLLLGFAHSVEILILARIIDGLFGSNMTVVQASLSDITEPKNRTKIFSISSGVFGAGLIFGPAIGGFLAEIDYSLPMFFAAGISLLSILLVITILPETYDKKSDSFSLQFNDIFPINSIKKYFKTPKIRILILLMFFYNFAFMIFMNSFTLIAIQKYQVTTAYAGYYRTWIGILRVILQFIFVERLLRWSSENKILLSGVIAMIISMIAMIFTPVQWVVFIPLTFLAYGTGVARPILTSQMTNVVEKTEYATILGISNGLRSITQIISPILGGFLLVYYNSSYIMILSIILYMFMFVLMKKRNDIIDLNN